MDPITAFLVNLIIGVVLSAASSLIQQALAPKQAQRQTARGFRGTVQTGGKVPLSFLVGTIGVPGKLEYRNTWGSSGETPNAYLVDVISFGDLPITDFTGLYVNSEEVTLTTTGHVTQGYPVADKSSKLWWEFFDGTQSTANTYLTGKFGSDADRPWQSDMIGAGIPHLTLTALIDEKVWSGFPSYMAEFQGIPLYDPREDTTAGGDGDQRWDTPSTWAFSDNNAVIVYNILRGIQDPDGNHFWGGHARASQVPYAVWAAAMDACDADTDLADSGTEKAYRAGREIFVDERPADVIRELMAGANMRIVYSGGVYYPLVGVPDSADFTFTDADVIVSEATTLDALPSLDDVVNGATATYIEPSQAWESKETAPYYRSDLEAEDDNRQQLEGVELNTTFSGTQAQRILKATVEESRRFKRHVVPLRPAFGQYRPLQVASWTSDANGYTGKLFLVTAKTEDPWGRIIFGLQEIDPTDFDWSADEDEQPLDFAPLTPILPPAQPMAGFAVSPYIFPGSDGAPRRPGILLEYTGAMPDIRAVQYEVLEDFGDGNTIAAGEITYDTVNVSAAQPLGGLWTLPDTDYEVRAKFLPPDGSGRETEWSAWLTVTTPDVGIGLGDLDASLQAMQDYFGLSIRDINEREQLATSAMADQDLANYADRLYVLNQQSVGDASTYAAATQALLLALGVDGSTLADAISAIETANGDVTAGFLSRITASASPGGGWVRYGTQIRAGFGEAFATVSDFWEVNSVSGLSRRVMKASETYFIDDQDAVVAMFDGDGASFNTAYIKDLTADNIQTKSLDADEVLVDGSTITQLIADNAVTSAGSAETSGSQTIEADGDEEIVQSVTVTVDGGIATVLAQVDVAGASVLQAKVLVYRDATLLKSKLLPTQVSGVGYFVTLIVEDTSPGVGSVTYTLRCWGNPTSSNYNVTNRYLHVSNSKK